MTGPTMRRTGRLVLVLAVLAGLVAMHGLAGHAGHATPTSHATPASHPAAADQAGSADHTGPVDPPSAAGHAAPAVGGHDAAASTAAASTAAVSPGGDGHLVPLPGHDCDAAVCVATLLAAASVLAVAAQLLARATPRAGRPWRTSTRPPRPPQLSALCVLRL